MHHHNHKGSDPEQIEKAKNYSKAANEAAKRARYRDSCAVDMGPPVEKKPLEAKAQLEGLKVDHNSFSSKRACCDRWKLYYPAFSSASAPIKVWNEELQSIEYRTPILSFVNEVYCASAERENSIGSPKRRVYLYVVEDLGIALPLRADTGEDNYFLGYVNPGKYRVCYENDEFSLKFKEFFGNMAKGARVFVMRPEVFTACSTTQSLGKEILDEIKKWELRNNPTTPTSEDIEEKHFEEMLDSLTIAFAKELLANVHRERVEKLAKIAYKRFEEKLQISSLHDLQFHYSEDSTLCGWTSVRDPYVVRKEDIIITLDCLLKMIEEFDTKATYLPLVPPYTVNIPSVWIDKKWPSSPYVPTIYPEPYTLPQTWIGDVTFGSYITTGCTP